MERRLPGSLDASQKQSRLQHSKNLSSNIITAEFYINGNFQLSHSSVSMRGPGTGGISQRRTQQHWQNWPSWDDTHYHTERMHRLSACQNLLSAESQPACLQQPREMLCLSRNPTLCSSQWGFTKAAAETNSIISREAQKATVC